MTTNVPPLQITSGKKINSVLKLKKIFQRFLSFQISPNAKYENSEILETNLTLRFFSETVKKSM